MNIRLKLSQIRETKWHEYLVRFVFGGLMAMAAGRIADRYGPVVGGLFLGFPSIFPATMTLVQAHKEEQEREEGEDNKLRKRAARQATAKTAVGTSLGGAGLLCFAIVIWVFARHIAPFLLLSMATLVWIVVNVFVWWAAVYASGKNDEVGWWTK